MPLDGRDCTSDLIDRTYHINLTTIAGVWNPSEYNINHWYPYLGPSMTAAGIIYILATRLLNYRKTRQEERQEHQWIALITGQGPSDKKPKAKRLAKKWDDIKHQINKNQRRFQQQNWQILGLHQQLIRQQSEQGEDLRTGRDRVHEKMVKL